MVINTYVCCFAAYPVTSDATEITNGVKAIPHLPYGENICRNEEYN